MQEICSVVKNMVACYLILNVLMQAVPGEKYRKYIRVFGNFLLLVCLIGQLPLLKKVVAEEEFSRITVQYEKMLSKEGKRSSQAALPVYSSTLSTMEEEIKTRINNIGCMDRYVVNAVNISVCEGSQGDGECRVDQIILFLSENVDKSVNISVNKIVVRQNDTKTENEKEILLKNVVAEELGVEPDVISVCLE